MAWFKWCKHRNDEKPPPEPEPPPPETSPEPEPPPPTPAGSGPYTSSSEHLWEALHRIDHLVRAQTIRWRLTIAASKPEHLWGMVNVTEAEVEAFLHTPFHPPTQLPEVLDHVMAHHWRRADRLAEIIAQREAQTPPEVILRLTQVQQHFALSPLERDILLVCLLPELDGRYRRLFGYLMDDASRTRPTVELVAQILYHVASQPDTMRAAFDAGSPLLEHYLLAISGNPGGEEPLSMRSLRVDDRIVAYLVDSDRLDDRLVEVISPAQPLNWEDLLIEPERLQRLQTLAQQWRQAGAGGMVLFLHGPYGSGRLKAARAFCTATQTPLLVANAGQALRAPEGWKCLVDLAYREAMLRGAALYWSGCEALLEQSQPTPHWEYLAASAERFPGLSLLASQTLGDLSGHFHQTPFLHLEFPVPHYALRGHLWQIHLPPPAAFSEPPPDRAVLAELLANGFQLTEGQILDAVAAARWLAMQRDPRQPRLTSDDLYEGCRRQSSRRLITFARRIEPRTELTFADLIIPPTNKRELDELRQRIRYRGQIYSGLGFERRISLGRGLIALFTGSSGTGKTMAAELLAREQGVDLYKVDLSAVVSKYVGETEKNLSRVFAEAEDANAILFFDEADALFGKRGEVKEAQDRWANMEVNYLLQRVEEYAGVVILTSNLRQNIDEAFQRRIHAIVEFPFPEAEARYDILVRLFPPGIHRPTEAELRSLAKRFKLSGGNFKNIVIDAAFRALAAAGGQTPTITLRHLVAATAREYQKLGKPIIVSEFGEVFYGWLKEDIL